MWMKTLRSSDDNQLDLYYEGVNWLAFPIPAGRRVLIATRNNTTLVISSESVVSCQTKLSGGSESTLSKNNCWLDCIQDINDPLKFYVIDALQIVGQPLIEQTAELRHFYLKGHFNDELSTICPGHEISFNLVTPVMGTYTELYNIVTSRLPYSIENILLVDKESEYSIGGLSTDCFITNNQKKGLFDD